MKARVGIVRGTEWIYFSLFYIVTVSEIGIYCYTWFKLRVLLTTFGTSGGHIVFIFKIFLPREYKGANQFIMFGSVHI